MQRFFWIVGTCLLALSACENDLAEVQRFVSREEVYVETAREVEMLYSDSAVIRLRIQAPTLLRHIDRSNPRQEFPDGLRAEFFGGNLRTTSRLSAKYAIRFENKNRIELRDSIVWISTKGERLETDELIWEEDRGRVFTNRFVTITRPDEIIYGYGFESNRDFTEWTIRAIEGRLKLKELKGLKD